MSVSPKAGKPADPSILVNVPKLITAYYTVQPDPSDPAQRSPSEPPDTAALSFDGAFNEWHILAITPGDLRVPQTQKIDGPLFLGMDTHALSEPAFASALEVLAANNVEVMAFGGQQRTRRLRSFPTRFCTYNRATEDRTGGRYRDHTVSQSSGGRRLQVRSSARWASRIACNRAGLNRRPTNFCGAG